MKRYGNLFEQAFTMESLHQAYRDARKGKRKKRAYHRFSSSLGANIASLYHELHNGSYHPQPYFEFDVHEPKKRRIYAPAFRDVVVQHAIYRQIYPIFDRTFIDTSFACRKGYGTHKASEYTQRALRASDPESWTLKLDIKKYFYSISRPILHELKKRKIKDERMLRVMHLFTKMPAALGIPIGNLLSQLDSLIYLNPIDHFIKRALKVRHYVRYVDDMLLVGLSKQQCREYKGAIEGFLRNKLKLELSKFSVAKIKQGANFVGYRTWASGKIVRKYSLQKFRRRVRDGDVPAVTSLLGHARDTLSLRHMFYVIRTVNPTLFNRLPKSHKRILICQAR